MQSIGLHGRVLSYMVESASLRVGIGYMVESVGLHGGSVGLHDGLLSYIVGCWITWWGVLGYMVESVGVYGGVLGYRWRLLGCIMGNVVLHGGSFRLHSAELHDGSVGLHRREY